MAVAVPGTRSRVVRVAIPVAALVGYSLGFAPLYHSMGPEVGALISLPVIAAGWSLGLRAGLVMAILAFPVNTLLLNSVGAPGWDAIVRVGGAPGMAVLLLIGAGVGLLHDLSRRLKREVRESREVQETLQETQALYKAVVGNVADAIVINVGTGTGYLSTRPS